MPILEHGSEMPFIEPISPHMAGQKLEAIDQWGLCQKLGVIEVIFPCFPSLPVELNYQTFLIEDYTVAV